jgi:hypothetical protein
VRFPRDVLQRGSMVRAIAQEGTYGDTATREVTVSDLAIGLASERTGRYTLAVSVPGFREWRRGGIRVRRSAAPCHFLRTVQITPRLRRP